MKNRKSLKNEETQLHPSTTMPSIKSQRSNGISHIHLNYHSNSPLPKSLISDHQSPLISDHQSPLDQPSLYTQQKIYNVQTVLASFNTKGVWLGAWGRNEEKVSVTIEKKRIERKEMFFLSIGQKFKERKKNIFFPFQQKQERKGKKKK